jgi:hypothetical protein
MLVFGVDLCLDWSGVLDLYVAWGVVWDVGVVVVLSLDLLRACGRWRALILSVGIGWHWCLSLGLSVSLGLGFGGRIRGEGGDGYVGRAGDRVRGRCEEGRGGGGGDVGGV